MDIPRIFNITESAHRIHNPITPEKLATLGIALRLESGASVLDLGSGSGDRHPQAEPGAHHPSGPARKTVHRL